MTLCTALSEQSSSSVRNDAMSPEHEQRLRARFPLIFRKVRRAGGGPAPIQAWGIACGDGWYDLIEPLCTILMWPHDRVAEYSDNADPEKLNSALERERKRVPALLQVKQKLGGLRIHVHGGDRRVRDLIGSPSNTVGRSARPAAPRVFFELMAGCGLSLTHARAPAMTAHPLDSALNSM